MIRSLERYDNRVAAGMLARAALELESYGSNPAAKPIVPGETEVRAKIIAEATSQLGVPAEDRSPETIERICDLLDDVSDELIGDSNETAALERLAERGELPSDLFLEINVIPNVQQFYGTYFNDEMHKIVETVKFPIKEQHYGLPSDNNSPFLVSLFARYYPNRYPHKSYYLLVVGQRDKLVLHIHQVWRIYPAIVRDAAASSLVEMLRKFAEHYGTEMKIGDQRGRFILAAALPNGVKKRQAFIEHPHTDKGYQGPLFTVTFFNQNNPKTGDIVASLAVAINLVAYKQTLEKMGW
jgi:hypothetical protein